MVFKKELSCLVHVPIYMHIYNYMCVCVSLFYNYRMPDHSLQGHGWRGTDSAKNHSQFLRRRTCPAASLTSCIDVCLYSDVDDLVCFIFILIEVESTHLQYYSIIIIIIINNYSYGCRLGAYRVATPITRLARARGVWLRENHFITRQLGRQRRGCVERWRTR